MADPERYFPALKTRHRRCFVGVDLGTSGCRAVAIDRDRREIANTSLSLPRPRKNGPVSEQDPEHWWRAVVTVLLRLTRQLPGRRIASLAVDGTSASLLIADPSGLPLSPALMYNDGRAIDQLSLIDAVAPAQSPVHAATSSLAKLLYLRGRTDRSDIRAVHQADWILGRLTGNYAVSDENNCLKLGYDAERGRWPEWVTEFDLPMGCLPRVLRPGTPVGPLTADAARKTGIQEDTVVVAGTTDSTAAAIASGVGTPGQAVSVLGSTLVLKVLSKHPLSAPAFGVYSQRLGDYWLVGGASNSGGAVCARYFSQSRMTHLSRRLNPNQLTGLDYYPLTTAGERFPIQDPTYAPRLTPRPIDDAVFFQALLEGIARIEKQGYELLQRLGAPAVTSITSIGGGASNEAWRLIREYIIGIPVRTATHQQAAYGSALLALKALENDGC